MKNLEQLTRERTGDGIALEEIEKALVDAAAAEEAEEREKAREDGACPGSDTDEAEEARQHGDPDAAGEAARAAKAAIQEE